MDYLRRSAVFTNCLYVVSAIVLAVYNTKVHAHITVIEFYRDFILFKFYTEHEFDIVDLIGIEHYCNQESVKTHKRKPDAQTNKSYADRLNNIFSIIQL